MEKEELKTSHYKILFTVLLLNERKLYPTKKGVKNIIVGREDDETIQYKNMPTYSTLSSSSGRRIAAQINYLLKIEYLEKIYNKNADSFYLKITNKGEAATLIYINEHKNLFTKKEKKRTIEIVLIE